MPLVINTNVASLNAQRQLVSSGTDMSEAMERLSSGRRINSAADDAAGLAISNRQTSQIRGLTQAIRNANDGVSLIQTAEGALDETTNILQRMRELSIQAANGIYSDTDRATLDAEFQQLLEELDRIAETTSFNGQKLLDGSLGDVSLQVGAEANQVIDFSISSMSTEELGLGSTTSDLNGGRLNVGSGTASSIGEGDVLINGQALSAITNIGNGGTNDTTVQDVLDDINNNIEGVSASGYNIVQATGVGNGVLASTETLRITLGSIDDQADVTYDISNTETLDDLVETINNMTGGNVLANINDDGLLVLSNSTGGSINLAIDTDNTDNGNVFDVTATAGGDALIETATGILVSDDDGTEDFHGSLALTSDDGDTITVTKGADGTDADLQVLGFPAVIGAGEILGSSLDATDQNQALLSGAVIINGQNIGPVDEDEGLQAKVDAINAVSDASGVTASIVAQDAFTTRTDEDYTELVSSAISFENADNVLINGVTVALAGTGSPLTADEMAASINAEVANTGVSAFVDSSSLLHLFSEGQITLGDGTVGGSATDVVVSFGNITEMSDATQTPGVAAAGTYTPGVAYSGADGSVVINGSEIALTDLSSVDSIVSDINGSSGSTGVRASIDDNGELQLSSSSRINIGLGTSDYAITSIYALGITLADTAGTATVLSDDLFTINPGIKLDSADDRPVSIEVTTAGATGTGLQSLNTDLSASVTGSALATLNITDASSAQDAISSIDQALETINAIRSDLGAINNRLEFTMSNLSNITENTAAARSRIVDADFAAESSNLSRAQVLQQASQAMLAQANAQPQQVLSLLQG